MFEKCKPQNRTAHKCIRKHYASADSNEQLFQSIVVPFQVFCNLNATMWKMKMWINETNYLKIVDNTTTRTRKRTSAGYNLIICTMSICVSVLCMHSFGIWTLIRAMYKNYWSNTFALRVFQCECVYFCIRLLIFRLSLSFPSSLSFCLLLFCYIFRYVNVWRARH